MTPEGRCPSGPASFLKYLFSILRQAVGFCVHFDGGEEFNVNLN